METTCRVLALVFVILAVYYNIRHGDPNTGAYYMAFACLQLLLADKFEREDRGG